MVVLVLVRASQSTIGLLNYLKGNIMSVERSTNYKVEVDLTEEEYALLYLLVNAPENAILGGFEA